ncbi:cuticle protein 16.8 [Trichonephila inaurata madagascariensis]|uniref:Cuticle protein 16.8 n=1 Tax=Trichonephila inaurata madagascariensis TaxID=2747483 RepID=A0A8X6XNJ9_9ARAC|nr:cuticle protein 16.8 [Trichonephila inaurata madagascariensis]
MFLIAIFSCIVLAQASIPLPIYGPQPYQFGYAVNDHFSDQYRQEAGNGAGGVLGSYGFTDARGIARRVNYIADHAGFRAQVNTNEPGTANQNPAAVQVISDAPYAPRRVVVANPILGLDAEYEGLGLGPRYGRILYDGAFRGLDYDRRYRDYNLDNLGYGGVLGYTGLLGGYNGIVNYGTPLLGGSVRGYDSRFANLA